MKKTNKLMAALLALVMCLSLLPMAAFAEETKNPEEAPFGEPYDGVITDAGEVEKDVPAAVEDANTAIEAIDQDTADKIGEAEKVVNDNEAVVNAANDTVTEAVNTANSAQQTVESAQQTVANAGTLAEREAALEIANAAVETAEQAVTEAQNALDTANAVYTEAEKAVEAAQKALDEITKEHNEAVGEAQDDLAAAKETAQKVLDDAQAKLDAAGTTRDELDQKAQDAQKALDTATGLVIDAEKLLNDAKDNAAGLQVDVVLKDEQKQDALKSQTEDVKGKKEALDELQGKADAAKDALDSYDTTLAEKQGAVDSAQDTLDGLNSQKNMVQGLWDEAHKKTEEQRKVVNEINQKFEDYKNTPLTIESVKIESKKNQTVAAIQAVVDAWKKDSALNDLGKDLWSAAPNMSAAGLIAELEGLLKSVEDKKPGITDENALKIENDKLTGLATQEGSIKSALDALEGQITAAEGSLDELKEALDSFKGSKDSLEEALENAGKDLKAAKDAYGKAVAELSKTLKGAGTAYNAAEDYDRLMEDAAKLQTAIDKLNELNQAIEDRDKADAAQKQAQYDYDHAMAGLEAAEEALAKAQEKVDNAAANASKAELAKLTANLEKAKADFETAKKAADEAKENKDKADQAKTDADQNATNAANRVQDAINDLNNIGIGDIIGGADITIDDEAVPLASGPVTRAEFVDYLWRHEGSPAAESELFADHEYAPAIAWALSAELIDETFAPDELVTVADVRAILGSFADVFGTNAVAAADLTTLTGDDGEAVLNCDQVLAEFFGEEYELPEDLDALETDAAA